MNKEKMSTINFIKDPEYKTNSIYYKNYSINWDIVLNKLEEKPKFENLFNTLTNKYLDDFKAMLAKEFKIKVKIERNENK